MGDNSSSERTRRKKRRPSALPVCKRSDYKVGSMLGQGSFATVHSATHNATGTSVAIKVVRSEEELSLGGENGSTPAVSYDDILLSMVSECRLMCNLGKHPNILQLLEATEDCRVLVLEKGTSDLWGIVKHSHKKSPRIPSNWLKMAKSWGRDLLEGIKYMHSIQFVHQDIKSSNVLIFPDRTAKLCDFGLAKERGTDTMIVDRELITLWYRPPELLMGDSIYTMKVDEWGVGCILLEMMIGESPFRGKPEAACTCPQITHRNFNADQLMRIFSLLGTPRSQTLLSRSACVVHFRRWPSFQSKLHNTLHEAFARFERHGVWQRSETELLNSWAEAIAALLDLDHYKRSSAQATLELPLFSGRPARKEDVPAGPNTPMDLAAATDAARSKERSKSPLKKSPEAAARRRSLEPAPAAAMDREDAFSRARSADDGGEVPPAAAQTQAWPVERVSSSESHVLRRSDRNELSRGPSSAETPKKHGALRSAVGTVMSKASNLFRGRSSARMSEENLNGPASARGPTLRRTGEDPTTSGRRGEGAGGSPERMTPRNSKSPSGSRFF